MEFSKKDTAVAKGVAILFLIAYHCFSSADRLNGCDVSFFPISQDLAFAIFESMNICVGMFAFLSAYGLTRTLRYKHPQLDASAGEYMEFVTKRIISLEAAFFIPFVIGVSVSFVVTGKTPHGSGASAVLNLIFDMFGVSGFFNTPTMIGTWWYMSFALLIIVLIPFTVALHKKFGALCIVPYLVVPVLLFPDFLKGSNLTNMTRWLLTIPLGVVFADYGILEKLRSVSVCKNKILGKLIKFAVLTLLLAFLFVLRRTSWCTEKFFYCISSILPVFFVYYLYEFVSETPVVSTVLEFFGRHSSNIFFLHTFVRAVWFPKFTYSFRYAIVIFLFMTASSLAMSFGVEGIKKLVRWDSAVKKATKKILSHQSKLLASYK